MSTQSASVAQDEAIWSALRDHLERDPRGRELLTSLRDDSQNGFGRFDAWLRDRYDALPQPLQAKVSGGQVRDIWQIAEVHNLNVQPPPAPTEPEQRDHRNRALMLNRVSHDWVEGWLKPSVEQGTQLTIGLEFVPEVLQDRWDGIVDRPAGPGGAHQPASVLDAFEDCDHRLLIVGDPGAGKTIALLQLLRALIVRADMEPQQPIPVLFLLAPWAVKRPALTDWLTDELVKRYDVPLAMSHEWVTTGRILPLLDGLDEVPDEERQACVDAINLWQTRHSDTLSEFALTCRTDEYNKLRTKVHVSAAVRLKPLAEDAVFAQLTSAGPQLEGIRKALEQDQSLRELATTPLVLDLLMRTYPGVGPESLPLSGDKAVRLDQVFQAYAELMLRRKGSGAHYAREKSIAWLSWLATSLTRHSQSVLYVERLEPDWIDTRSGRLLYALGDRLVVSLLLGVLAAGVAGLVLDGAWAVSYGAVVAIAVTMAGRTTEGQRSLLRAVTAFALGALLTCVLTTVLFSVLVGGIGVAALLNAGLIGALIGAPVVGLTGGPSAAPRRIQLVERVTWSLTLAIRSGVTGLAVLVAVGLILALSALRLGISNAGLVLLVAVVVGAPPAIVTAILGGFDSRDLLDESQRLNPNQGIRRAGRTALISGGLSAIASAATVALTFGLLGADLGGNISTILGGPLAAPISHFEPNVQVAIVLGLIFASLYGLVGGLAYGGFAFLSHYVLRWILWRLGATPLAYVRFLNYASDCLLLRKVGGGYKFIHGGLSEYFTQTNRAGLH